eukprot:gene22395-26579_t
MDVFSKKTIFTLVKLKPNMGSKERIERLKAKVYQDILDAAMTIIKQEGYDALSIRKIADKIEYKAVLIELSREGFSMLMDCMKQKLATVTEPHDRMEAMLMAYLLFATKENELYQLMYQVGTGVADVGEAFPALATFMGLFREEMQGLVKGKPFTEETFGCNYLVCISFVHGLVALNRYYKNIDPAMNDMVLKRAIGGIIHTIELS